MPPALSKETAATFIARYCDFSAIHELARGGESEVFECTTAHGPVIARLGRTRIGYDRDAAIAAYLPPRGIATPVPHAIEDLDEGWHLCLAEKIPGTSLSLRSRELRAPFMAHVASALSTIHDTPVTGSLAGPIDTSGRGTFPSWRDWVAGDDPDTASHCARIEPALRYFLPEMKQGLFSRIVDAIMLGLPSCPEMRCLVHGDFSLSNVLAGTDGLTGVLDWSAALIGDPVYDLGRIWFWSSWDVLPIQDQLEALLAGIPPTEDLARRIVTYGLRSAIADCTGWYPGDAIMLHLWIAARAESIAAAVRSDSTGSGYMQLLRRSS